MDTKSQKGDSDCAAAANNLTQMITKYDIMQIGEESAIADTINDDNLQNTRLLNTDHVNTKSFSDPPLTPTGKSVKTKKRTKQEKIPSQNWRRRANAFQQQRQHKQFTYSVSYFNWAVSDEEEEEDDTQLELSSCSHLVASSSCNANIYHSTARKSVQNLKINRQKVMNKQGIQNQEVEVENEVSELSVISSVNMGVVLTEEYIDVTLPLRRLNISRKRNSIR